MIMVPKIAREDLGEEIVAPIIGMDTVSGVFIPPIILRDREYPGQIQDENAIGVCSLFDGGAICA